MRPFLALLAVAATSCAPKATRCAGDADCGDAVCDFGACRAVLCNADADCDGRSCVAGACVAPVVDSCPLPETLPLPGAVDVDVLADVRVARDGVIAVHIETAGSFAAVSRTGRNLDVPTASVHDDTWAVAVPLAPFAPDAQYTVVVDMACGQRSFSFTTAHVDTVAGDDFAPRVVLWDLANVEAVPAAASGMLGIVDTGGVVLSLDAAAGELGFLDENGGQRTCEPTLPLLGHGDNPRYSYSGTVPTVSLQAGGLSSLHVRGVARDDHTEIAGVITLDARRIAYRVIDSCVPGATGFPACAGIVCSYAATLGLACEPCDDDGEPYCTTAEIRAPATSSALALASRSLDAVCADDACADTPACR